MLIGDRIKNLRVKMNITQSELAKSINSPKQTIYKYENNIVTNIPSNKIEKLAAALNSTPAYLMGWESDEENMVSFFDFIEFANSIGCNITPFESGNCKFLSENNKEINNGKNNITVGCENILCIDCPKFIKSYKVTYKDKTVVINHENYTAVKNEIISFAKYKINEMINENI
jgi:transcriptional regulator with XRE-family HTH domain